MFSLETIKAMNQEAGDLAKSKRKKPVLVKDGSQVKGVPHLGTRCSEVDKKHERVATLFCDTSGWGSPGEPAMTQEQFKKRLDELIMEHGPVLVALEELGQFQGYVAVWSTKEKNNG